MASGKSGVIFYFKIFLYRNIPCGVYLIQQEDDQTDEGDDMIPGDHI